MKTKNHIIWRVLPVILLSACAADPIGPGLQALQGRSIQTAIEYLGYPDNQQEIVGDTVYSWVDEGIYTDTYPITGTDYGRFEVDGRRGTYENRRQTYISEVNSYRCTIRAVTTEQDIIKHTEAKSVGQGCYRYRGAFRRIIEDFGIPQTQLSAEETDLVEKPMGTR